MRRRREIADPVEATAQVAVGEDAGDALCPDRRPRSCPCPCRSSRRPHRASVASSATRGMRRTGAHDVAHVRQQPAPERAAGMRAREILDRKAARVEQRQRERVAERQRGSRAGRGREPERAGLGIDAGVQMHVGRLRQRRLLVAGERDEPARPVASDAASATPARRSRPNSTACRTTSSAVIMPRSPWLASAACTKNAGVPVDASVAASLRAMWPDLPMPVTTTRPRQSNSMRAAARKAPPSRACERVDRGAPRWRARRARARARAAASMPGGGVTAAVCSRSRRRHASKYSALLATRHDARDSAHSTPRFAASACATFVRCHRRCSSDPVCCSPRRWWSSIACRLLRLPPILGYLVVGIVVGPHALAWVPDNADGARPRRVRHRLPDVLDRPRIQPAAAEGDAAAQCSASGWRRWRSRPRWRWSGCTSWATGWLAGLRARWCAGDELDRDRLEDAGRAQRARHRARPRRDGHPAVPGPRRGCVPDRHADARRRREPICGRRWRSPAARPRSRWR